MNKIKIKLVPLFKLRLTLLSALFFCFLFLIKPPLARSCGMTLHMYMADKAVELIQDPELKSFLLQYRDAYLNGSYYPDAGYAAKHDFGEFSHWDKFLNHYLDYLHEQCPYPFSDRCLPLISHYLGVISHDLADVNFDKKFMMAGKAKGEKYDGYDTGIDLVAIFDQNRGRVIPKHFVPMEDLLNIYARSSLEVKERDIARGTKRLRLALYLERPAAALAYGPLRAKYKWADQNYMTAPGGVLDTANEIAKFWEAVWYTLKTGNNGYRFYTPGNWPNHEFHFSSAHGAASSVSLSQ